MKISNENGLLTIFLAGRIDSGNAAQTEEEITALRAGNPHDRLIFDADELEYISSAGLRVVLRTRKEEPTLKIINVTFDVYEIFSMTGFTEMLPVEKGYRKVSVDGCKIIGQGANGTVYRLDEDTIIKVYKSADALPDIERERELARKAFVLGIPTAIPYDVVRVGESYGSVFELLNSKSFAELIADEPENKDTYIDLYTELVKKIHSTSVRPGDMPSMKEIALDWAAFDRDHLSKELGDKLTALVEAIPESDQMLHGDYHVKNVMMQNGETLLIDMDTLCVGDPVFEFGFMFLAYVGNSAVDHENVLRFLGLTPETAEYVLNETLRRYFGTDDPAVLTEAMDRAKVVGCMRMLRRVIRHGGDPELVAGNTRFCQDELARLLPKVDSLSFGDLLK